MHNTTRRMIENFAYLINNYGFVPNGGRIYYLRRSQPPLFIPMVYEYYAVTKNDDFLISVIDAMEKANLIQKLNYAKLAKIEKNNWNTSEDAKSHSHRFFSKPTFVFNNLLFNNALNKIIIAN